MRLENPIIQYPVLPEYSLAFGVILFCRSSISRARAIAHLSYSTPVRTLTPALEQLRANQNALSAQVPFPRLPTSPLTRHEHARATPHGGNEIHPLAHACKRPQRTYINLLHKLSSDTCGIQYATFHSTVSSHIRDCTGVGTAAATSAFRTPPTRAKRCHGAPPARPGSRPRRALSPARATPPWRDGRIPRQTRLCK